MTQLSAVKPVRSDSPAPGPRNPSPGNRGASRDEEIDLAEVVNAVVERKWLIVAVTLTATLLAGAYAVVTTPVYRADAMLHVEEDRKGLDALKDLTSLSTNETQSDAEIQLIRSRSVAQAVVDALRLDIIVEPRYLPLVGRAYARRHSPFDDDLAAPVLGLRRFAWGGERIKIERLSVPKMLEGHPMRLEAREGGRYALLGPDGELLLQGAVGTAARAPAPQGGEIELLVAELKAHPGTRFNVLKLARAEAVRRLREELQVAELGKKTGVIQLVLDGPDRDHLVAVLDAVAQTYVQQNVALKAAEAEMTLQFISRQLPLVKETLEKAEAALNEHRTKHGTVDLPLEAQAVIQRAADIEKASTELGLQLAELRQRFTDSHPSIEALREKLQKLRSERAAIEGRMRNMPDSELASVRLTRDVKVANELYLLLLNKAEELKVLKSGTLGNVRIVDSAEASLERVRPNRALVVLVGLMLGAALGVALAIAKRALNRGVEDPYLLEQALGLSVYASVPNSAKQEEMLRLADRGHKNALAPLAAAHPSDLAVESLRSLRTSLQFALLESNNNIIALGGPRPGVGKSFVSVNLAHIFAESGQRVVLVDVDMRRGQLHRYFQLPREGGLSEIIRGQASSAEMVRPTSNPNLSFLPTGAIPTNPSELLGSSRFRQLLTELSERYDLVLLDAPPILAVTDAALIAQAAGVNLLVLKSGLHPMREVELAADRFQQAGVKLNGLVLNNVPNRPTLGGINRYHYQYEYK